jgi:hypothetical protein
MCGIRHLLARNFKIKINRTRNFYGFKDKIYKHKKKTFKQRANSKNAQVLKVGVTEISVLIPISQLQCFTEVSTLIISAVAESEEL